jgi:hypothetical protein
MTTYSQTLVGHLVGASTWTELPVTLQYRLTHPFEVAVFIGDEGIEWKLSRELLRAGTAHPAGEGDVRFWPVSQTPACQLFMLLSPPSGRALFELPREAVLAFLRRTESVVPTGTEESGPSLDAHLRALLGDAS